MSRGKAIAPLAIRGATNTHHTKVTKMNFQLHQESGIKIFPEFIHPEDLDNDFLRQHGMNPEDVFIVSSSAYLVKSSRRRKGEMIADEINSIGLDEWIMGGGSHPKVKWCGGYAIYESDNSRQQTPTLIPCKGKTWLFANGEIFDCLSNTEEVKEWGEGKSKYSSGEVFGSWNDKGIH